MRQKIIGVTVGTPLGISTIKDKLNPVTSVNGVKADEKGNVSVTAGVVSDEQIARAVSEYLSKNPSGVPSGGKAGQYLRKKSDTDRDVEWADFEIPEQYGLVTYDQYKTITIT